MPIGRAYFGLASSSYSVGIQQSRRQSHLEEIPSHRSPRKFPSALLRFSVYLRLDQVETLLQIGSANIQRPVRKFPIFSSYWFFRRFSLHLPGSGRQDRRTSK